MKVNENAWKPSAIGPIIDHRPNKKETDVWSSMANQTTDI